MSITNENPEKKELTRLVAALATALNHECDRETEPCKSIHLGITRLRHFFAEPKNWEGDLSMTDVGELFHEAMCCGCGLGVETLDSRQHVPDCDMWDPKADEFVQVSPPV